MAAEDGLSTPPFRAVGFLLSSLGYAASRGFHRKLAPLGLDPRAFSVLRSVGFNEGQSQQALASALAIPASRMVAILDGLEAKGLLQRRLRDDDRRSRAVHLTEAGNTLLRKAFEIAAAHEKWICEGLSDADRDRLIGLLDRVGDHLGLSPGAHSAMGDKHRHEED
ncbi:MAG TPA: MarR family transcriptional regulator [Frankiaceae bacterium]|nr:MarR family transcriptional regulator [Frankiaceae bacterium]